MPYVRRRDPYAAWMLLAASFLLWGVIGIIGCALWRFLAP